MPNYTLTPPFVTQSLTVFNPAETLLPLYHLNPPFVTQGLVTLDPAETLLPLYHLNPPFTIQPVQFFDPRVFSVTEPDEILKNETRKSSGQ